MDRSGPSRTHARRRIGADPTSTALLLAGPTALEMWPGVRRVGEVDGRVLVEAALVPGAPQHAGLAAAQVRALPPRRTPTSYVTRFEWSGPGLPVTTGVLTLGYLPGADGTPWTSAELTLESEGLATSRVDRGALQAMADGFLDNLASAAEARNRAA